jgi:hypothetical protein
MSDERRRVLDLLAQGKITIDEADQLLRALGTSTTTTPDAGTDAGPAPKKPRFIRINVHKPSVDRQPPEDINIRVPFPMVRGGLRLGALLPGLVGDRIRSRMREKGLDFDWSNLDPAAIDAIFGELNESGIDVESGRAHVRITCE